LKEQSCVATKVYLKQPALLLGEVWLREEGIAAIGSKKKILIQTELIVMVLFQVGAFHDLFREDGVRIDMTAIPAPDEAIMPNILPGCLFILVVKHVGRTRP
jgi:hypothetical protein